MGVISNISEHFLLCCIYLVKYYFFKKMVYKNHRVNKVLLLFDYLLFSWKPQFYSCLAAGKRNWRAVILGPAFFMKANSKAKNIILCFNTALLYKTSKNLLNIASVILQKDKYMQKDMFFVHIIISPMK